MEMVLKKRSLMMMLS